MRILAHIPAREGSDRLKLKNLLPLEGRPVIAYTIEAARQSRLLTDFYVNTESLKIAEVARNLGAKVYERDQVLSQADVTQDTFNYDFICKKDPDILVLINPVCPLIEGSDIDNAIQKFLDEKADCLVTTTDHQSFAVCDEKPINFSMDKVLPRTQDVGAIRLLNFAVGIWDAKKFRERFEKTGSASLFGKVVYQTLPKLKSIKLTDQEDFDILAAILKAGKCRT